MEARETGRVGDIEGAEYEYVTLALFETPLRQSGDRQSSGRSVRGRNRNLPAIPLIDHHLTPDRDIHAEKPAAEPPPNHPHGGEHHHVAVTGGDSARGLFGVLLP